jgi:hypothetical protein
VIVGFDLLCDALGEQEVGDTVGMDAVVKAEALLGRELIEKLRPIDHVNILTFVLVLFKVLLGLFVIGADQIVVHRGHDLGHEGGQGRSQRSESARHLLKKGCLFEGGQAQNHDVIHLLADGADRHLKVAHDLAGDAVEQSLVVAAVWG